MAKSDDVRIFAKLPEELPSIFNSYFTSVFTSYPSSTKADLRTKYDNLIDKEHPINTNFLNDITLTLDHVAVVLTIGVRGGGGGLGGGQQLPHFSQKY